jgi:hypothetical protein
MANAAKDYILATDGSPVRVRSFGLFKPNAAQLVEHDVFSILVAESIFDG